MIGFRHVMMSIGKLFTQLLSSLNLVDVAPIGMADEIDGNDTLYKHANAFEGTASITDNNNFLLAYGIQLTNSDNFTISGYIEGQSYSALVFGGESAAPFLLINTNLIDLFTSPAARVTFNTLSITPGIKYKWIIDKVGDTYTGTLIPQNGDPEVSEVIVNSNTFDVTFTRLLGRVYATFNSVNGTHWDFTIFKNSSLLHRWPMPEYITAPSTHIAYDVSGNGNHATLVNGSTANRGLQDTTHYHQLGFLDDGVTQQVPILEDLTAFADGTPLSDPDANLNDGFMWLNDGSTMEQPDVQVLKDADIYNVWFDVGGNPKKVTFSELETAISTYPNVYGGIVVSGKSIKNISLK